MCTDEKMMNYDSPNIEDALRKIIKSEISIQEHMCFQQIWPDFKKSLESLLFDISVNQSGKFEERCQLIKNTCHVDTYLC